MAGKKHGDRYIQIYGKQPVSEALASGWPVKEIILRKDATDPSLRIISEKATREGIPVTFLELGHFDSKFPRSTQGVMAKVREVEFRDLEEVLASVPDGDDPLFVALDGIQDPQNLGAICRTAHAMGVHGVVVPRRRVASLGEGAAKASAGAIFYQPICEVPNIHYFIEWAKHKGLWVYGLEASGQNTLWDTDVTGPLALIVGSEGKGLSRLARERCDFLVRIPMYGKVTSLNASVACGIALGEIRRQRSRRRDRANVQSY